MVVYNTYNIILFSALVSLLSTISKDLITTTNVTLFITYLYKIVIFQISCTIINIELQTIVTIQPGYNLKTPRQSKHNGRKTN